MRTVRGCYSGILLFMLVATLTAAAHPLGNFTINHLARISASANAVDVRYILDIAEIPTFQIMRERANGTWTPAVMQSWADDEVAVVQNGFHLSVDGAPVRLEIHQARANLRPGAGGLPIIRWVAQFHAPFARGGAHRVDVSDEVYADRRIGWKDIVVGTQSEPTDELQRYPSVLIGSPRRIDDATFTVLPSGVIAGVSERTDTQPVIASGAPWVAPSVLSDMFSRPNQRPLLILLTLLTAFGLGALHALEPGHGKALLAFTLFGARATTKQALILASSLTFAHTAGVVVLGIALFFAAGFVSESIYPWITLLSGLAIAIIGARALARYVRIRRSHAHGHGHHGHDPAHGHDHTHAIEGSQPLNFNSAVWAAMSGGIAPCPAAIVVLLTALRLHHVGYGLVLIVLFSMGLAGVLSGLGIGVVHGAAWLSRRSSYARLAPYAPLVTATVISIIGAWTLAIGFTQQGVAAPVPIVAALVLAAIAGYASSQRGHSHVHGEAQPT
ncbi:MAG: nickel/cobalt transporter [Vulcanimicrobiaceae bacterium]